MYLRTVFMSFRNTLQEYNTTNSGHNFTQYASYFKKEEQIDMKLN